MKLDRSALADIALRLVESRRIMERTHQRISQSLDGLVTVHDIAAKASRILQHATRNSSAPSHPGK